MLGSKKKELPFQGVVCVYPPSPWWILCICSHFTFVIILWKLWTWLFFLFCVTCSRLINLYQHEVAFEGETGKVFRANFHDRDGRTVLILRPAKQVFYDLIILGKISKTCLVFNLPVETCFFFLCAEHNISG